MKVLLGGNWKSGFLDYSLDEEKVRVEVKKWVNVRPIGNQYISYSANDWKKVLNYLRKDGLMAVLRKVYSRYKEKGRNQKWFSVGLGYVLESRSTVKINDGDSVIFTACNHPRCIDQTVVDHRFVSRYSFSERSQGSLAYVECEHAPAVPEELLDYQGWTPESGWKVNVSRVKGALDDIASNVEKTAPSRSLSVNPSRPTQERSEGEANNSRLSGSLFGLGHYAKSVILPNLPEEIGVSHIHEIDPVQLGKKEEWDRTIDTSKHCRPSETPDIFFIAGYHHTHASLAVKALEQESWAVVEKPLCTTHEQLGKIKKLYKKKQRLFTGFHKRYSSLNEYISEDLGVKNGECINYYCIVYEIPLPDLHWYNWPNSKSRVVSNGCHWLDHFMYLNDYSPVKRNKVYQGDSGDMIVVVELQNNALFSMTLTDSGSDRLGVREHVQLRANGRTVRVIDNSDYEAENGERVLRRESVHRRNSYSRMYREIGRKIVKGEEGDSLRTFRSTKLMLDLERAVQSRGIDE